MIAKATLAALTVVLIFAAAGDIRNYRIPNAVPLSVAALFFVYVLLPPSSCAVPRPVLLPSLLTAAGLLTVGAVLFHFRIWGGGDAKLMASLGLWAGPQKIVTLCFSTALAGGLVAVILLLKARLSPSGAKKPGQLHVPYAVALAIGGFFTIRQPVLNCFG